MEELDPDFLQQETQFQPTTANLGPLWSLTHKTAEMAGKAQGHGRRQRKMMHIHMQKGICGGLKTHILAALRKNAASTTVERCCSHWKSVVLNAKHSKDYALWFDQDQILMRTKLMGRLGP